MSMLVLNQGACIVAYVGGLMAMDFAFDMYTRVIRCNCWLVYY